MIEKRGQNGFFTVDSPKSDRLQCRWLCT